MTRIGLKGKFLVSHGMEPNNFGITARHLNFPQNDHDQFNLIQFWDETLKKTSLSSPELHAFRTLFEQLFCVSATQTSVERIFSLASRIRCDPRKSRLLDQTMCDQVFVQYMFRGSSQSDWGQHLLSLRKFFQTTG